MEPAQRNLLRKAEGKRDNPCVTSALQRCSATRPSYADEYALQFTGCSDC